MGKSTISMSIFNSYVTDYQAGYSLWFHESRWFRDPEEKLDSVFPVWFWKGETSFLSMVDFV